MEEEQKVQNNSLSDDQAVVDGVEDAELLEAKKQAEEYLAGWQRTKADFVNYKREEASRLEEAARYSAERFMREMITVLDSFDLGLSALEKQGPVEKGIYMIRAQFEDVLKRNGLVKIQVVPGTEFDPALAEAIGEIESDLSPGTVADVIEPGYEFLNRVLRPARVRLAK